MPHLHSLSLYSSIRPCSSSGAVQGSPAQHPPPPRCTVRRFISRPKCARGFEGAQGLPRGRSGSLQRGHQWTGDRLTGSSTKNELDPGSNMATDKCFHGVPRGSSALREECEGCKPERRLARSFARAAYWAATRFTRAIYICSQLFRNIKI